MALVSPRISDHCRDPHIEARNEAIAMRPIHIARWRIEGGTERILCAGGLKYARLGLFLHQGPGRPADSLSPAAAEQSAPAGRSWIKR